MRLLENLSWHFRVRYSRAKLRLSGAKSGHGCLVSPKSRVIGPCVEFGDAVLIDSFCTVVGHSGSNVAVRVGDNAHLWPHVMLDSAQGSISIGSNVSIGSFTEIYGHGGCIIGDDRQIAGHCYIISTNHAFDDPDTPIRLQGSVSKGVVLEDDCWLGHAVTILDGVTVGRGSVIGACSVVTRNIPPFCIAVGNPARVVGSRTKPECAE